MSFSIEDKYSDTKFKEKSISLKSVDGLMDFALVLPKLETQFETILSITKSNSKSSNVFLRIAKVIVY